VLAQRGVDHVGGERLLAREDAGRRFDERDLRAQRCIGLGELDADDARAEHQQPGRDPLARRCLTVGPGPGLRQPGDRRKQRLRSGGDDDRLARDEDVISDADPALALQAPAAAHDRDAALLQPRLLTGVVEAVDDLVAAPQHGARIEAAGDRLADAGHALGLIELERPQQRLGRHAGIEGALAADEMGLDEGRRTAPARKPPSRDLAGWSSADHDDVELALAHAPNPTARGTRATATDHSSDCSARPGSGAWVAVGM